MAARSTSRNHGVLVDASIPDDREIVGALVVLADDEGNFTVYPSRPAWPGTDTVSPEPEVLMELAALIRTAWQIANADTHEGSN